MDKVLFSSNRDDWETPLDFFKKLNNEFHFVLDAAATAENAKCSFFFSPEQYSLNVDPATGEIVEEESEVRTMAKMTTIRIILKSGSEFAIKCDKFTITQNGFGQETGYNIKGIRENKPVYLDFEQIAAVVRVYSDEKEVGGGE